MDRRTFVMGAAGAAAMLAGCAGGQSAGEDGHAPESSETQGHVGGEADEPAASPSPAGAARVFLAREVTPAALARVWDALAFSPEGNVAVKVSTGESEHSNHLRAELVGDFIRGLGATIVECNTAYGGARSTTEAHLAAAEAHGFTAIADVDIMDAEGSLSIPMIGGAAHLSEDLVGAHLANYDTVVSLAHFKGHAMGGFGGAIKNCSIGIASAEGKSYIHRAGVEGVSIWDGGGHDEFLESMAEACGAVMAYMGEGRMAYVNVMNRLSVDCDCDSNPAEPDMADIGILASLDPVALDRACVDLVYAASDGASLIERMESRNGIRTLEWAEALGIGSQSYELMEV